MSHWSPERGGKLCDYADTNLSPALAGSDFSTQVGEQRHGIIIISPVFRSGRVPSYI